MAVNSSFCHFFTSTLRLTNASPKENRPSLFFRTLLSHLIQLVLVLFPAFCPHLSASTKNSVAKPHNYSKTTGAVQKEATVLAPGAVLERELKGGEAQTFVVHLAGGQFLHVEVEQIGIDVAVTLFEPG